jgi:hypothetical protein
VPSFKKLTSNEVKDLSRRQTNLAELTEYLDFLRPLRKGDYGKVELEKEDSQRTIKRRTTIAASQLGKNIKWRRSSAEDSVVFEVT